MSEANLLFENRDGIAWLTLNRPKGMNAINGEIIELYEKYIPEIANNDEIRAVVITGTGAVFCAGADLSFGEKTFDKEFDTKGQFESDYRRDAGGILNLKIYNSTNFKKSELK